MRWRRMWSVCVRSSETGLYRHGADVSTPLANDAGMTWKPSAYWPNCPPPPSPASRPSGRRLQSPNGLPVTLADMSKSWQKSMLPKSATKPKEVSDGYRDGDGGDGRPGHHVGV